MKRQFSGIFRCLLPGFILLHSIAPVTAFTSNDVNTAVSAFNSAFYYQSGANANFKNNQTGGVSYFWTQANMIQSVIDAYEWSSNKVYLPMITNLLNGFTSYNGVTWINYTIYNDDIMWAVQAFARGGVDTGNTNYYNLAKINFDECYARAYDNTFGGGLWWSTDNNYKNAAVNGPASIAASLLYQIYGDPAYYTKATNIYAWEKTRLLSASGSIADGYNSNGVTGGPTTYNQGTFIGAADFLGLTNDAALVANFTMMNMTSGGILPDYGIGGNNSGFNAIYLRWLTRYMKDRNLQNIYEPWLQTNATAAWNGRRGDNLSWCQWPQPTPEGTNFYSWDCISSVEALIAAYPTEDASSQAVPGNEIGYWPLDGTSGTTVPDVSGNSNNGTASNTTWSSNGRINGCLVFNGSSSSVQITNPVCNDFSIVFWVKTPQLAGTGQWYNGRGLVDGDVGGTTDDFGTALVGGKFAFGVGNPDTTIVSTSAINDNTWHFCVATRQEATGIISIYVDGRLEATSSANRDTLAASARLLFGAINSGGGYFDGSLDDIKIFSRTLTAQDVSALYESTAIAPSSSPANLAAVGGNAQVRLSWSDGALATSYNVKRSLVSGGPYVTITNVTTASFIDTNASNYRSYYYVVSSVNAQGESADSPEVSASPIALIAWFKADAITNLTNGATVPMWADASGNGNNAVQPSSIHQPTYVTGAMNGLPVVRFNAAGSNYLWFYRPVQDDFTIICIFQSTQGYGSGTLYYQGAGLVSGEVSGVENDFGTCLFANGTVCAGTGNPDVAANSGTGLNNGVPHILAFVRTKATGQISLYINGASVGAALGGKQSLTSPNQLVLGAQQTLLNYLTGDIAEVQIYNAVMTPAQVNSLASALKCKYGLTGGGTPIAPTGLIGVAGNRTISLSWTLTPGATGYNLWRSTDNGATYQAVATGLATASYVDTNAANGQTNYYQIAAADDCGGGANSVAVGVYLPLPALGMMSASTDMITLSWPGWANDWSLLTATNLTPPIVWTPVTNMAVSNNGVFNLTLPIGMANQYFRLASP